MFVFEYCEDFIIYVFINIFRDYFISHLPFVAVGKSPMVMQSYYRICCLLLKTLFMYIHGFDDDKRNPGYCALIHFQRKSLPRNGGKGHEPEPRTNFPRPVRFSKCNGEGSEVYSVKFDFFLCFNRGALNRLSRSPREHIRQSRWLRDAIFKQNGLFV